VTTMLCTTIMQAALLLTGADPDAQASSSQKPLEAATYSEAHRVTEKTGKPMIVMIGTDWCSPCQMMKNTVLPQVRDHGLFRQVSFAVVNPDKDSNLATEITGGGPIPQLVMFRKTRRGWVRRKLVGGQSVETVEEFIHDGLASDAAEKKGGKDGKSTDVKAAKAASNG
jgi:thioredoxin-like negative regulator of GroEL